MCVKTKKMDTFPTICTFMLGNIPSTPLLETRSHNVAQANLKLTIQPSQYMALSILKLMLLLPQSPKCWNYKCVPPILTTSKLFFKLFLFFFIYFCITTVNAHLSYVWDLTMYTTTECHSLFGSFTILPDHHSHACCIIRKKNFNIRLATFIHWTVNTKNECRSLGARRDSAENEKHKEMSALGVQEKGTIRMGISPYVEYMIFSHLHTFHYLGRNQGGKLFTNWSLWNSK